MYPQPDVPVEDAWNNMQQLLQQAPAAPASRPGFSFGKGVSKFIMGTGIAAIVSVIIYVVAIKKEKPASSQTHSSSGASPSVDTLKEGATAYKDSTKTASHEFNNTPFKEAATFL